MRQNREIDFEVGQAASPVLVTLLDVPRNV